MLSLCTAVVVAVTDFDADIQEIRAEAGDGTERKALNYVALTGAASVGDTVTLNTTAVALRLGTGGFDFVTANRSTSEAILRLGPGHIMKGRYLPNQIAVLTLEEQPQHADVWERSLEGMPVIAGQLHSQLIPAAFAAKSKQNLRIAYIMTDGAALPLSFSNSVRTAKSRGLIDVTLTCGQAFGGDYETVTLYSALLAARHIGACDLAFVCQGPGNAGTGTRLGYTGIEQAGILDSVERLGGLPIAVARVSSADPRPRHQGISHHTITALELAYAKAVVPLPVGVDRSPISDRHDVVFIPETPAVLAAMVKDGWKVRSMGRDSAEDPLFFESAIAAGIAASAKITKL